VTPGVCAVGDAPENYTYTGGSYVAQGTLHPLTVTNAMCGRALTGSPVFTMVVPKSTASPTTMNLKVSAPYCGTFFAYEIDCPVDLPSFVSSTLQLDTSCNSTQNETYYFVRNATGTSTPFTLDVNTLPEVGNFVFTDVNGSTYLNDTGVLKYYIIGTTAFGVRNGVVISSTACVSSTYNSFYSTSLTYASSGLACAISSTVQLWHNGSGLLPVALDTIYQDSAGAAVASWSNYKGITKPLNGSSIKSMTVNGSGIVQVVTDCTSSSTTYILEDCTSSTPYTVNNDYIFGLNDVVQYQIGTPGTGAVYCGTIINVNSSGTADATLASSQSYGCGDSVHCAT